MEKLFLKNCMFGIVISILYSFLPINSMQTPTIGAPFLNLDIVGDSRNMQDEIGNTALHRAVLNFAKPGEVEDHEREFKNTFFPRNPFITNSKERTARQEAVSLLHTIVRDIPLEILCDHTGPEMESFRRTARGLSNAIVLLEGWESIYSDNTLKTK